MWRCAVDDGGHGRGALALGSLSEIRRSARMQGSAAVESLAASTRGSLLRQAGRHADAYRSDSLALMVLPTSWATDSGSAVCWPRAAVLDALVGLAADNLGLLRFAASDRLLARAATVLQNAGVARYADATVDLVDKNADWDTAARCLLRWHWVAAELGLYRGDAAAGLAHARRGLELAEALAEAGAPTSGGSRHRVKTELIYSGALAAVGHHDEAVELSNAVVHAADRGALLPLRWAALALLAGLDVPSGCPGSAWRTELAQVRAELRRRGMPFDGTRDNGW